MTGTAPAVLGSGYAPPRIAIEHPTDVAEAARAVLSLSIDHGFSQVQSYYLATAVIELGNNIIAHAQGRGFIEMCLTGEADEIAIEIVAADQGPGIVDVAAALEDGFSTNGGLGCGLPGVARLMDAIDIATEIGQGTRIWAKKKR